MEFKLIQYRPEYRRYFETLNKAWLEEYFTVEPIDKWVLENPEAAILDDGGYIFFVLNEDEVVIGTAALKRADEHVFELTKMAVEKKYQGKGAGRFICSSVISEARKLGAKRLILYSQTSLAPAISIYRKLGFKEITLEKGKYARADIKMEIVF